MGCDYGGKNFISADGYFSVIAERNGEQWGNVFSELVDEMPEGWIEKNPL